MDFLDPAKKRSHQRRLLLGYVLVGVAIALASVVLLFQSYGYDLDRKTGKLIQNGLVFIAAHPESAEIYVNGKDNNTRTDTKLTIPAGQYTIELKRDGYREWKRTFALDGGSVVRLAYPMLFPTKLVTNDVQQYATPPGFASESPDRHWLLVAQPGSFSKFDMYDLSNTKQQTQTTITLPSDILTTPAGAQSLALVEWSTDNRHLLVRHDYAGGSEFVMIDRETPSASFNVTKTINTPATAVTLRDKRYDQYYVYNAASQSLQTYDLKSKQLTAFLEKVLSYKTHGSNMVLYATDDNSVPGKVAIKLWDGGASYLMRAFAPGSDYHLDLTQFNNDWYMVMAPSNEGHAYIYKNPQDILKKADSKMVLVPFTVLKIDDPQFVSFSDNARFIAVQSGSKFAVYDIETDRRYYYDSKLAFAPGQQATWMDGHRLLAVIGGKNIVYDYDGINMQTLSASYDGFLPFFDRDYVELYNVAPSVTNPAQASVIRTELKAK